MLSLFPELLFLSPAAAFLIRVAVGLSLAYLSYWHIARRDSYSIGLGVIEAAFTLMLITGFYTQAAALASLVLMLALTFMPSLRELPRSTIVLLTVMCMTLLLTGPGPFAFDLPL